MGRDKFDPDEMFDVRTYDGTSLSREHANGLIEHLGGMDKYVRTSGMQPPVKTRALTSPPADPEDGDRYLVGAGALGEWDALDDYIVEYDEEIWDWTTLAPGEGMLTYVEDEDQYYSYDGDEWGPLQEEHAHPTLPTVDEKAALQGTAGAPGPANRYVTDDDPRLAGVVGGGPQMVTLYIASPIGGLNVDPTVEEIDAAAADDHTRQLVMYKKTFYIPASSTARSVGAILRWAARASSGTGETRWAISVGSETVGLPPSIDAIDLLSSPKQASTTEEHHTVSGLIPEAALPTGSFSILLIGRPHLAGQSVTAKILTESSLELVY